MLYYVPCSFVFCSPFRWFFAGFCPAGLTLFWRLKSADFVGPDSLFSAIRICLSSTFAWQTSIFLFGFSPCKTTKTGSRARIVGFCQFQNLSIGKMHKVFLHPSGASALNFHAQKSAEKNFVSKEPRKSAFLHRHFRSRSAAKTCAMLVLPSGEATNRTERRHDEPNDVKRGDANSSGRGWLRHLPTMSTVGAICAKHSASSARLDRRSRYNLHLIPWAAINGKAYQRLFCGRGETSE